MTTNKTVADICRLLGKVALVGAAMTIPMVSVPAMAAPAPTPGVVLTDYPQQCGRYDNSCDNNRWCDRDDRWRNDRWRDDRWRDDRWRDDRCDQGQGWGWGWGQGWGWGNMFPHGWFGSS